MRFKLYPLSSDRNAALFFRVGVTLVFFTLALMILGSLVRAEDAGLACPDWPLCKGQWIPPMDYQVLLEWLHRFVAALLSIIFAIWSILALASRELRKNHGVIVVLAIALLILQIALGALTITKALDAYVVSFHLLNAMIFWSVIIYCTYKSYFVCLASQKKNKTLGNDKKEAHYSLKIGMKWAIRLFLILIFIQLFLGVRVSANEAGRVCNTFPACYDQAVFTPKEGLQFEPSYFPPMQGNIEKHMTHRFMAYLLLIWILALVVFSFRQKLAKRILIFLNILLVLIVLQIIVGALNVVFSLPTGVTVLHSFLAYGIYFFAFLNFLETNIDFYVTLPKEFS